MGIELRIWSRENGVEPIWANFGEFHNWGWDDLDGLNELLTEWNGYSRSGHDGRQNESFVEFETERDLTVFLLRWQ